MRITTQIDVRSKSANRGFALPRKKFLKRNEAPTAWAAAQNWAGIAPDPESGAHKCIPDGSRHIRVYPGLWRGFRVVPAL